MADVVRNFTLKVRSDGLLEVVADTQTLDKTLKKTSESAGAADRRLKGVGHSTNNATSAFAKQAQGLGGIVRIYATVAANIYALSSAYSVLKRNADLEILRTSSQQLSVATGQNFDGLADSLVRVTGGAITFRDAMQSANLALSGGFSGKQATQITEIATKAANALGRSVPEAVQRLTQAIVKGEPELADEFGIILRVTEATNEYAKALGKLPTELTTAQKQQALFNQFLEQGTQKFANVQIQTNPYDKLAASFEEITNKVTEFVRIPLDPIINLLSQSGLALSAVFAAIAGGIGKLLLPELKNLSEKMAESAKLARDKAFEQFTASREMAAKAQSKLNDELYDYVAILQAGIKKDQLSKIDLGGFDADQLARELSEESGNIGSEVRDRILKNVFAGDELTMRKTVGKFVDGLNKEINKATAKGLKDVDFRGFTGSVAEARAAVEALGVAYKTTSQIEREAATNSQVFIDRQITRYRSLTAEVRLYGSAVKAAVADGYSVGLEKGFLSSLFSIKDTFTEINEKISGKGIGRLAGYFGAGAKLAGGFIGSITKLAGLFGQLGLVISTLSIVLGPIVGLLGLFSDETKIIEEAMEKNTKNTELYNKQLDKLKSIGKNTFEDVARGAELSNNIANDLETQAYELITAFKAFDDQSKTVWGRFTLGASDAVELTEQLATRLNRIRGIIPTEALEKFDKATEFTEIEIGTKDETGSYEIATGTVKTLKFTPEQYAAAFNAQNSSSEITARVKDNKVVIEVKTAILATEEGVQFVRDLEVMGTAAINMERIGQAYNKTISSGKQVGTEATTATVAFKNSLTELGDTLSKEAVKLNNVGQSYNNIVTVLERLKGIKLAGGNLTDVITSLPDEIKSLLADENGVIPKEITSGLLESKLTNVKTKFEEIAFAQSDSAIETSKLNKELISVSDRIQRGDSSALTEEYRIRRDLIGQEIILQEKAIENINIQLGLLGKANKDSQAAQQLDKDKILAEQKISELREKQNIEYSDQKALQEVAVKNAATNEKIAGSTLSKVTAQATVLDKIASLTGNTSDLEARLRFEDQITAAKEAQLLATINSKLAEASRSTGTTAAELTAEVNALQVQLSVLKQIAALNKVEQAFNIRNQAIELENKELETGLKLKELSLQYTKESAELAASNKFYSTETNDAASLLALEQDILLANNAREQAIQKVNNLREQEASIVRKIKDTQAAGIPIDDVTKELKEKQLEISIAVVEAYNLQIEKQKALQAIEEERFEIAKKNANLFKDPVEFQNLLGKQFTLAAKEFGEKMGNTINQIVDVTLGSIDAGIDAFVDAVYAGENALKAAGKAVVDTFNELNTQIVKDIFKKTARDILGGIFGKDIGKSDELIVQESMLEQLISINANISRGALGGVSNTPGSEIAPESSTTTFIKNTFESLKKIFSEIGSTFKDVFAKISKGFVDFISEIDLSGVFDSVSTAISSISSAAFSGGGGGFFGGVGNVVSGIFSGITSLFSFFAKGGITGEILKKVPMYAKGTITSGPELAMIGEGPKREAVVPLPDNRSIPVDLRGAATDNTTNNISINITGVQGTEQGLNRSANQIGMRVSRAINKANGRNG